MHWFVHKKLLENFPRYILKNGCQIFKKTNIAVLKMFDTKQMDNAIF